MSPIETLSKEYETRKSEAVIGGHKFSFLAPGTLEPFIDHQDMFHDFPLWAKIWEPSLILADHLARLPVNPEERFLEIGCGLGVVGIVASSFGHNVIMTDCNSRSLSFAQASAQINHCANLEIMELDWNNPRLEGSFDYIVGAEVIYAERDFKPLRDLFGSYLKPGGEVILAGELRRTSVEFFKQMDPVFDITAQKKVLRSEDREVRVVLARLSRKK